MRIQQYGNKIKHSYIIRNLEEKKYSRPILKTVLLPGIGDIIYSWYKLMYYVKMGYDFHIYAPNNNPRRGHQLCNLLPGFKYFTYINMNINKYFLIDPIDFINANKASLFDNIPVFHINSFLESNINYKDVMPNIPIDYNIEFILPQSICNINKENFNIVLYTSNYRNNRICDVLSSKESWVDIIELVYNEININKDLFVYVVGANYDADLTIDTYNELCKRKIKSYILLNDKFFNIINLIKNANLLITYESGLGIVGDVTKTPTIMARRRQLGRNDEYILHTGLINPDSFINYRFFEFFSNEINLLLNRGLHNIIF